jgi:GT2 family glycosyltransferase
VDGVPSPADALRSGALRISVLVPTYARTTELLECIRGLEAQTLQPLEVIVAIPPGDDETREALASRDADAVTLIEVAGGYVHQVNASRAAANGEVIAFTDDDAVPRPDWLARIQAHFLEDPSVGGVGGRDVQAHDNAPPAAVVGRLSWYGRLVGNHHSGFGPPRPVDVLKGVNMAYRVAALDDVWHDTRLLGRGMQPESEIGFCLALRRDGWKLIYDPAVLVDHHVAERPGEGHRRFSSSPEAVFISAHNEFLGLAAGLSRGRRAIVLAYALLVGTRENPGPVLGLERMIIGREGWAALRRMRAATRGRLRALSTARRPRQPL